MKLTALELRRLRVPLVSPFRTSFGTQTSRDVLLLRAESPDSQGWGECVALEWPVYSSEYVEAAAHVIEHHLAPRLFAAAAFTAAEVATLLAPIHGHRMAKAAIEAAVLDAELRHVGQSMAGFLGATKTRVPAGVSVGIHPDIASLLDTVSGYLTEGYLRIKLKIEPGYDVEPVAAVRREFGADVLLQVDANSAYTLGDAGRLARLDEFDLLLIEQPLPPHDVAGHAALARKIRTPICLDESIESAADAADAIARGATAIVNIKAGRVGGYLEARKVAAVCAAHGVPVWCGGMLETGIGRAANVALAALPEFTLPGDTSASGRFYRQDITAPFELSDGHLDVPQAPGLGVDPLPDVLDELTTSTCTLQP